MTLQTQSGRRFEGDSKMRQPPWPDALPCHSDVVLSTGSQKWQPSTSLLLSCVDECAAETGIICRVGPWQGNSNDRESLTTETRARGPQDYELAGVEKPKYTGHRLSVVGTWPGWPVQCPDCGGSKNTSCVLGMPGVA